MKNWAFVAGAVLAVSAVAVVIVIAVRRAETAGGLDDISDLISDCHDRIRRIEAEIHQLKPLHAPTA